MDRGLYTLGVAGTIALLAACGGLTYGPDSRAAQVASIPDGASIANSNLLYVAGEEQVYIYTYPQGNAVGSLGISGAGICADRAGDVFIPVSWENEILEYAHGGTVPIATLDTARLPEDCSIDPTTGSLAVTFLDGVQTFSHHSGDWGPAQTYTNPDGTQVSYCAYDSTGNLFIDGYTSGSAFRLIEMPARSPGTFTAISLNVRFELAGGLYWNRRNLVVTNSEIQHPTAIYRFAIAGNHGTRVGMTVLDHGAGSDRILIRGSTVVTSMRRGVGFWQYPAGGEPKQVLQMRNGFYGVAFSVAPRK